MPGLKDNLQAVLERLTRSAPEIRASAFVSLEGLMMASAIPPGANEDAVAAMTATVQGLGERTSKEFKIGELQQVYFKGSAGFIILQQAEEDGVLVAVTDETTKLGVLFLLLRRTAAEISKTVSQALSPLSAREQSSSRPGETEPNVWG